MSSHRTLKRKDIKCYQVNRQIIVNVYSRALVRWNPKRTFAALSLPS